MRLSAAMREGSALAPQIYGEFVRMDGDGDKVVGCCALGAVCLATNVHSDELDDEFTELSLPATHPVSGMNHLVDYIIYSLNDVHHWTREQIADWLEAQGL